MSFPLIGRQDQNLTDSRSFSIGIRIVKVDRNESDGSVANLLIWVLILLIEKIDDPIGIVFVDSRCGIDVENEKCFQSSVPIDEFLIVAKVVIDSVDWVDVRFVLVGRQLFAEWLILSFGFEFREKLIEICRGRWIWKPFVERFVDVIGFELIELFWIDFFVEFDVQIEIQRWGQTINVNL